MYLLYYKCISFIGDYKQNVCKGTNCKPCLPSCVGIADGDQPFPTKLWMEDYIRCYKNRTITAKKCPPGQYFHPIDHKCKTKVDKGKYSFYVLYNLVFSRTIQAAVHSRNQYLTSRPVLTPSEVTVIEVE